MFASLEQGLGLHRVGHPCGPLFHRKERRRDDEQTGADSRARDAGFVDHRGMRALEAAVLAVALTAAAAALTTFTAAGLRLGSAKQPAVNTYCMRYDPRSNAKGVGWGYKRVYPRRKIRGK